MARLIDADALLKQFPLPEDMRDPKQALKHITGIRAEIECAPTIEPKKGEWRLWDGPNWYICSECGAVRRQITFMEYYCPNCGARMENSDDSN